MDSNVKSSGDACRKAALELARRFDFEEGHALQDENLALRLFAETARLGLHDLGNITASAPNLSPRDLLSCAAILHDIGYWYGYAAHHKHSYKMIMEAGLAGVSARDQNMIALIARYHRGRQPDPARQKSYAELSDEDQLLIRKLSAILRFADGLDRTHTDAVTGIDCLLDGNTLLVTLSPDTGNAAERWAGQKKAGFFEDVFGVSVALI